MRPSYIVEKDGEQKTVPSLEMQEMVKNGWTNLGKADVAAKPSKPKTEKSEPVKGTITPEYTEPEIEVQSTEEIETSGTCEIESPEPETLEIKNVDKDGVPEDLVCIHCGAKARTKTSYLKNHGENCLRKVK